MAPTRLGDGTDIDTIRLGDGIEIAEVRTGAGDTVFSGSTFGADYAASYLSTTGGTLFTVTGGGNINNTIDSMSNGDALLLGAGNYNVDMDIVADSGYVPDFMRDRDVLVAGDVDVASNVRLFFDWGAHRDSHVFSPTERSDSRAQIAFLIAELSRPNNSSNYAHSIVSGTGGNGIDISANATNCIIDLKNYFSPPSWEYNNDNCPKDVRFTRCSFANYSNWQGEYSIGPGTVFVDDTIYEDIRNTYSDLSETNITTNVSLDSSFNYNTSNLPDSGHLHVPNTNAIF